MVLKFKVNSMVHRSLVSGDKVHDVVLVKLIPVGQVAGDVVVCVEKPRVTYKPEEYQNDPRTGLPDKRLIAKDTVIQETVGEAGGETCRFVEGQEVSVQFST